MVEFQLEEDISDIEAVRLIEIPPSDKGEEETWKQSITENEQTLRLDDTVEEDVDPFSAKITGFEVEFYKLQTQFLKFILYIFFQNGNGTFTPVIVGRSTLLSMDSSTVLVCKWNSPLRYQFFRNILPELPVTMCNSCYKVQIN